MRSSTMAKVSGSKRAAALIGVIAMSAALALFGLGGMAGKSSVSTCNTDALTVETAVAAFHAENPGVKVTSQLLTGNTDGGPYLASWPTSGTRYAISVTPAGAVMVAAPPTARKISYAGSKTCDAAS